MARKFKWLTGDPSNDTEVAAELAGYIKLDAFLKNVGATDGLSDENGGKHFERDYPLGEGNGVLLKYREDGSYGYHPPNEESWEDEDVMSDGPLYPGFVYIDYALHQVIGEAAWDKIAEERGKKYVAHYRRHLLLENASDTLALAWNNLRDAIMALPSDPVDTFLEGIREPTKAFREAQRGYSRIEQMTDDEIMAAPGPS